MQKKAKIQTKIFLIPIFLLGLLALFPFGALASGMSSQGVIDLVNAARKDAGLSPVVENSVLKEAATAKAKDMIKKDYFAHTSPEGLTPWDWFKKVGYKYKYAGENLAINYTSAKEQHAAWMKSKTHRANILNEKYQEIGVAIVEGKIDGETSVVTVQMFGTQMSVVADKATPVVPPAEVLITDAAVKGSEVQTLTLPGGPIPLSENLLVSQNQNQLEERRMDQNVMLGVLFLIFSLLAAPLVLLFRAVFILEAVIRNQNEKSTIMTEKALVSAALYLAVHENLKPKKVFSG